MLRIHVGEAASAELTAGLEAEVEASLSSLSDQRDNTVIAWWRAMGTPNHDRSSLGPDRSK